MVTREPSRGYNKTAKELTATLWLIYKAVDGTVELRPSRVYIVEQQITNHQEFIYEWEAFMDTRTYDVPI